jgi:hypothetical protein
MLTFAEIKRRAQVGTALEITWHSDPRVPVPMARTVRRVQTNAIVLSPWPGRTGESWLYWPKGSDIRIDGPEAFTVLEDGQPLLSYRFV